MRQLRRGFISFWASILLVLLAIIIVLLARSLIMTLHPEPGRLDRIIIFAELGNRIFKVEKRDTHGLSLESLYSPRVIAALKAGGYEVSMAVDDFSPAMAVPVRKLNRAGVRVWVWPLHSIEDGYWLATDNAEKLPALYSRFKMWTRDNGIRVHGVMLDMEPTYRSVEELVAAVKKGGTGGAIGYLLKGRNPKLHKKAVHIYADVVARMKRDGLEVSSFNIPYVLDDRLDGDDSIQEMFHVAFVESDLSIYMLYRSYFMDSGLGKGAANAISYARSLGGGSAGIGSYMRESISFEDFSADLRIAARYSPVAHVYNLESLVYRGWLPRMGDVDLKGPLSTSFMERLVITGYRLFFFILDLCTGWSSLWGAGVFLALWFALWRPWGRRTNVS